MTIRTIRDAAAAIRGRRSELGWSQGELSRRAHVSRKWVSEFEAGKAAAEFQLIVRVLDALDLQMQFMPRERSSTTRGKIDLDAVIHDLRRGE